MRVTGDGRDLFQLGARAHQQRETDRQQHLATDLQGASGRQLIERAGHRTLNRILERHQGRSGLTGADRVERGDDRRLRDAAPHRAPELPAWYAVPPQ